MQTRGCIFNRLFYLLYLVKMTVYTRYLSTASAMLAIQDMAFTVSMNDYVSEPFNPNELRRKIAL